MRVASVHSPGDFAGREAVDKEVAEGVGEMVVVAVLDGELAAAFGVAIGAHSADETSTAGMEEEPGRAGGGGESGTDHLEAVDDGAGTRADAIAGLAGADGDRHAGAGRGGTGLS